MRIDDFELENCHFDVFYMFIVESTSSTSTGTTSSTTDDVSGSKEGVFHSSFLTFHVL